MGGARGDDGVVARAAGEARGGFTIIELLVSVLIIALLMAVLIVGVRAAGLAARGAADNASARAIAQGVSAFEIEFSFVPPLVHDGGAITAPRPLFSAGLAWPDSPLATVPTPDGRQKTTPAVYSSRLDGGFLRGRDASDASGQTLLPVAIADQRYSKFSLSYYVAGALGRNVDGVDGPGSVAVERNGTFRGVFIESGQTLVRGRKRVAAFFDSATGGASLEQEYWDPLEYGEHQQPVPTVQPASLAASRAIVDGNGRAFRYYRWEPEARVSGFASLNIPRALLDPILSAELAATPASVVDPSRGDGRLKGATWAVVGAGPDGLFGTEAPAELASRLGGDGSAAFDSPEHLRLKAIAQVDNAVEVGR